MRKLLELIKGKRTYVCAALLFVAGGLEAVGVIPKDVAEPLKTFLAAGAIAALRAAK